MEEQDGITINATLVAKRESDYTVYVFKNQANNEYISCTKCPNWTTKEINVGQEGFLTYKFVKAGKDSWYSKTDGLLVAYQYTANYFLDFIPSSHVIRNQIVEKQLLIE